jgi:hypothetical protein
MLHEDLQTVRGILRKKILVKAYLRQTASWCRTGLWCIEGPYARHVKASLPQGLRDAIRGIRKRQRTREFAERIAFPWFTYVPHSSSTTTARQCSIAYLSSGGDWKLFDLENELVWTRPANARKLEMELEMFKRFRPYFHIPPWHTLREGETLWRLDKFICAPSLVHCSTDERLAIVNVLLQQFATFGRSGALAADSRMTADAIRAIEGCAVSSIPYQVIKKHREVIEHLGAALKLLPAHGDLNAQNVYVIDRQPWIIDWDTAGHSQPMLYDVLYLILSEATFGRVDLLEGFLNGCFDENLEQVLLLSGLRKQEFSNFVILMHNYIVHFHFLRDQGRRDAHRRNIDDTWNPLSAFCWSYI